MNLTKLGRVLLVAGMALGVGCTKRESMRRPTAGKTQQQSQETLGRAELRPMGESNARGTVVVREQQDGKLHVKGRIRGLEPNSEHTVLLNPAGECASAPTGEQLAFLGTVKADANGNANLSVTKDQQTLGVAAEIIGSSLIVRESGGQAGGMQGRGQQPTMEEPQGGFGDEPGMGEEPGMGGEPRMGGEGEIGGEQQMGEEQPPVEEPSMGEEPQSGRSGQSQGRSQQQPRSGQQQQPERRRGGQVQPGERQMGGEFETGELEQAPGQHGPMMEACAVIVPESQG